MKPRALALVAVLVSAFTLSGCVMAGEPRRCWGLAFPFVKVGVCERTR